MKTRACDLWDLKEVVLSEKTHTRLALHTSKALVPFLFQASLPKPPAVSTAQGQGSIKTERRSSPDSSHISREAGAVLLINAVLLVAKVKEALPDYPNFSDDILRT